MILKNIKLKNFRNYENLILDFDEGINIIYGNNAQGKTNLLESIYVLALTKSHRSFIDEKLVKNNKEQAKITGILKIDKLPEKFEILLSKNSKIVKINRTSISKISNYISKINVIIFYPDDLELIKGSPSDRRRYLNSQLSQLDSNYITVINDYNKLLKMRNDYLKKEIDDETYFEILNNYLIEKGSNIYLMRLKYLNKINELIGEIYKDLIKIDSFEILYKTNIEITSTNTIEEIKEKFKEKLIKSKKIEKRLKTTLIGPHRDDIEFFIEDNNIKIYGSQGQQRIAVLSLKLSEIEIFKNYKQTSPILLLDDVFSELDDEKKNNLLKYIDGKIQVIITTTDLKNIKRKILNKAKIIKIFDGKIIEKAEKYGTKK